MKGVKKILVGVLTGISVAVALALVGVAYSDHLHPATFPLLCCAGMTLPVFLAADLVVMVVVLLVRWRRAWIAAAALVLAYPAIRVYLPLHFSSQPPAGSIKVLSYNVACYNSTSDGHNSRTLDDISNYLRQQQADIVCLQEDAIHGRHEFDNMAGIFPYNDTMHLNRPQNPLINAIGIHTRFPIVRKERIAYDSEANGSVAFFLLVETDTVMVVNNHLESTHLSGSDRERYQDMLRGGLNSEDTQAETRFLVAKLSQAMAKRAAQAEAVHHYIEQHSQYPTIVCGDFNDTPISYCRRTVAQGLTDCYVETGRGLGISFNQEGFYFRIDQMMCSKHFEPYACYVDKHTNASDHYPIICWLKRKEM